MVILNCIKEIRTERNVPQLGLKSDIFYFGLEAIIDDEKHYIPAPFTFTIIEDRWVKIPIDKNRFIEFSIADTDKNAKEVKELLMSCNSLTATDLKVFRTTKSSGTTVELGTKPLEIKLAFVQGQETDFTDLETADGEIEFDFDFSIVAGGSPVSVVIFYIP